MSVHEDYDHVLMPIWDANQEAIFAFGNDFKDEAEWETFMDEIADDSRREAELAISYPAVSHAILQDFTESTYILVDDKSETVETNEEKWHEFDLIIAALKQRHSTDGVKGEK